MTEAQAGYRRVLQQEAGQADALYLLGLIAHQSGKHDEAIRLVTRAMARRPDSGAFHNTLGDAYRMTGQLDFAERSLLRARALLPTSTDVATNLALVRHARGNVADALPLLFEVLAAQPHRSELHGLVVSALQGVALTTASDSVRAVLVRLCHDESLDTQLLADAVLGLTMSTSAFAQLETCARAASDPFETATIATTALIDDPLLRAILPRVVVSNARMERVLTNVRRAMLLRRAANYTGSVPPADLAAFCCTLARQCFNTEYAWHVSEAEERALEIVLERLHSSAYANDASRRFDLVLAACYAPLHTVPGWAYAQNALTRADSTSESEGRPPEFAALVREQVEDREREALLAQSMPSLSAVANDVSMTVQAMYEENPYPRWRSIERPGVVATRTFMRELRGADGSGDALGEPATMLVAGGGTGRQSIQVALQFADAEVLAIDLSRASLAYAARKAAELGVRNLSFAQADLLLLPQLGRQFDVISCSGVLHHLADPLEGWRKLLDQLAPDGVMKIGLYATRARHTVDAAREFVRAHQFTPTEAGIRACRQAILDLPSEHAAHGVTQFLDFYSTSGCRDLVMHPQERTYTVPELAHALESLSLRFLGFQLDQRTRQRFSAQYASADALTNLACWELFESENPDTFAGMYQFWCCRR